MRDNSYDRTIERNYLQKWRFLIPEYEAVTGAGFLIKSTLSESNIAIRDLCRPAFSSQCRQIVARGSGSVENRAWHLPFVRCASARRHLKMVA